jgi:hypothetical protein
MTGIPLRPMLVLVLAAPLLAACTEDAAAPQQPRADVAASASVATAPHAFAVSGSAALLAASETIHSTVEIDGGLIQRSTIAGRITGDLDGVFLFHPTSVIDFASGTIVNTGTQVFAGSVAGSDPVILHDDRFHFEIDLGTGATTGTVHFGRSNDAAHRGGWFECDLVVVGVGISPEGDILSEYTGHCAPRGNMK